MQFVKTICLFLAVFVIGAALSTSAEAHGAAPNDQARLTMQQPAEIGGSQALQINSNQHCLQTQSEDRHEPCCSDLTACCTAGIAMPAPMLPHGSSSYQRKNFPPPINQTASSAPIDPDFKPPRTIA